MTKQVGTIRITTTVTLTDGREREITTVTTTEHTHPGVFGGNGDANLNSTVSKIHETTKRLGETVAVQAVAALADKENPA